MKKTPRGYVRAPQKEMEIDGGFRLMAEDADDGARIAAERQADRTEREEAKRRQLTLF